MPPERVPFGSALQPAPQLTEASVPQDGSQLRPADRIQPWRLLAIGQEQEAPGSPRREWLAAGGTGLLPGVDPSPLDYQAVTDPRRGQPTAGDQVVDASDRDAELGCSVCGRNEIEYWTFLNHSRTRIEQETLGVNL